MNFRIFLLACLLSGGLLLGWRWQLQQRQAERTEHYRRLAWALRINPQLSGGVLGGGAEFSSAGQAFLEGKAIQALRALTPGRTLRGEELDLREDLLDYLTVDLKWPEQVVHSARLEEDKGLSVLLVRAVQSGYFSQNQPRLDCLAWDGQACAPLKPRLLGPDPRPQALKWKDIQQLKVVHLDRQDPARSQLWLQGRESGGRAALEIFYRDGDWCRWQALSDQPARLRQQRVILGSRSYQLLNGDWLEVR